MPHGIDSFQILHGEPARPIEIAWRACLADSDFPTHYTAPEYFCEPMFADRKPFAILSFVGERVTAVMTGIHYADRVQSGLSNRPQVAFSRHVDRSRAMDNLITGLLHEAGSAKLIDLFVWSDMDGLVDARFRRKPYRGVVMLDLGEGPDALFRKFSQTRRNSIRWAIKHGVSIAFAKCREDVSAYYEVYVDWARRRLLQIMAEEKLQEEFSAAKQNRRLLLARYNGEVVAGLVLRLFPGGVVEHSATSSLLNALHLRPNDLLHWRAIEWACAEGLTKYGLGDANMFARKFGGRIMQTTRHRLDLSLFRRHTIGDWVSDRVDDIRPFVPQRAVDFVRSAQSQIKKLRFSGEGRSE